MTISKCIHNFSKHEENFLFFNKASIAMIPKAMRMPNKRKFIGQYHLRISTGKECNANMNHNKIEVGSSLHGSVVNKPN